jgi:hypothetical protein
VDAAALTLGGPDASLFNLVKSATSLVLQASVAGLAGDYNSNGVVDASDYVVWRNQLNASVPAGTGADGDGNGIVNNADYSFWKARFGNTAVGSGVSNAGVPEPGTSMLAAVFVFALALVRGNRSSQS